MAPVYVCSLCVYCGVNWRGSGRQAEAIENLRNRGWRINSAKNSHTAATAIANQYVQFEHTFHQLRPGIVPWMTPGWFLKIFAVGIFPLFSSSTAAADSPHHFAYPGSGTAFPTIDSNV